MVVFVAGLLLLGYLLNLITLCNRIPSMTSSSERTVNTVSIAITTLAAVGVIYLAVN